MNFNEPFKEYLWLQTIVNNVLMRTCKFDDKLLFPDKHYISFSRPICLSWLLKKQYSERKPLGKCFFFLVVTSKKYFGKNRRVAPGTTHSSFSLIWVKSVIFQQPKGAIVIFLTSAESNNFLLVFGQAVLQKTLLKSIKILKQNFFEFVNYT